MSRRDDSGLVMPLVLAFTVLFAFAVGVVFDGGHRLVQHQRAIDEAEASGDYALGKNIDVSHSAEGGLRLDADKAVADAKVFISKFGHRGSAVVSGTSITVTVEVEFRARFLPFLSGTMRGSATSRPITGVVEQDRA